MDSDGSPTERCGFVLEPGGLPEDVAGRFAAGSDEWYEASGAVCCWRQVWGGADDGRCIWHAESEDKPADALIQARADRPERFDGAYVPAVKLGDAIDFEECGLQGATFDGTGLRGVSFAGVDGGFAQFPNADLEAAQFPDADLEAAQFPDAGLFNAQFADAVLSDAQFPDADLEAARFPDADLRRAEFPDADLFRTELPDADLSFAQFPEAFLVQAQFPEAFLLQAQFPDADLKVAQFPDATILDADLTDVDARAAKFTNATLEAATLSNADLGDADLTDVRLHDAHMLDVRINDGTKFDAVATEEADAGWFDGPLHAVGARLRWWLTLARMDADERSDCNDQLERARTIYRTLQRLYRENSMPRRIDSYYVRARDTRRKQAILARQPLRWLYLATQRWVMGYGERPRRVVATSLVVIGLGALLYPIPGIRPDGADQLLTYPPLVAEWPGSLVATARVLAESVYFSTVTFTTLGYGDVAPVGWGKALATVESFVGALLMALLVYVLGRRATR